MKTVGTKLVNRAATARPAAVPVIQRATQQLGGAARPVQTAMRVSSPRDPAEHEAETTATRIMRRAPPTAAPDERKEIRRGMEAPYLARYAARAPLVGPRTPDIQRKAEGQPDVGANVTAEIQASDASGQPLPHSVRQFMEPRFRADFGGVRIHTSDRAATLNRQLAARAFTTGRQIFFGRGQFRPESEEGKELIAHELTHTIQQGSVAQRSEDTSVRQQAPVQVQRLGISDVLDYFADKANNIPGFRMFTILLGVNPINMSRVERSAANILRAIVEFLPGGHLIVEALDNYGIFDKIGRWVDDQLKSLGINSGMIRKAIDDFLDSLSWRDIFHLGRVWDRAKAIFTDPINRIISFAKSLAGVILTFIKDAILRPLAALAAKTRGYDLLKAVLGRDPITGEPVPQTAEVLIAGFMKLIGQEDVWRRMQESKAIPRAWAWFKGALAGLFAIVSAIPGEFIAALKSLTISDVVLVVGAFAKVGRVFVNFIGRFISWGLSTVWNLLEIIFDVVSPGALGYIKRTGAALKAILKNPLPFVGNLVRAAKGGFLAFADNFLTHLKEGLLDWLTGSLPGIYIPKAFTLQEIVKFVLSVLGLTWANIRQKLVKVIGEPAMAVLEKTFDIVITLVREGPAAAWDKIKEQLGNLQDMVVGGIIDMVVDTIKMKAIPKLVAMFIPGAGFISAILSIYDMIMVFVNKIAKIVQVVRGFIDSLVAIAAGQIGAAIERVEGILAGLLTLAINFLAGFAGIGKVADKVMGVIQKIRAPIDKAMDWLVGWIVKGAKALIAKGKAAVGKVLTWAFAKGTFTDDEGTQHSFYVNESNAAIMVASTPQAARTFVNWYVKERNGDPKIAAQILGLITNAEAIVAVIDKAKSKDATEPPAPAEQQKLLGLSNQICALLSKLVGSDQGLGKEEQKYLLEGQVGTYETVPKPVGDKLTPDHQPQASIIMGAADFFQKMLGVQGGELKQRAENRAKHGYAINLHFKRHVAGATYGSKGETKEGFYKGLVTEFNPSDSPAVAKRKVSDKLKAALRKDVARMKEVAGEEITAEPWKQLREEVKDEKKAKKLKREIADRIVKGENQIASQPLDF